MDTVTVIKLNTKNIETWRYFGTILREDQNFITIKAFFNRPDLLFFDILLRQGDQFIETFYFDRWYNIFAIHDKLDKRFKGLYCNIAYPALFNEGCIRYVDLALDLLIYPDGRQLVLDEDEFDQLSLPDKVKFRAESALEELKVYSTEVLTEFI